MKRKSYQQTNEESKIISDPFGSYTGIPADKNEIPVQDADDL